MLTLVVRTSQAQRSRGWRMGLRFSSAEDAWGQRAEAGSNYPKHKRDALAEVTKGFLTYNTSMIKSRYNMILNMRLFLHSSSFYLCCILGRFSHMTAKMIPSNPRLELRKPEEKETHCLSQHPYQSLSMMCPSLNQSLPTEARGSPDQPGSCAPASMEVRLGVEFSL